MKTENNILIAFLLNLFFSIFEIIGGIFTNSYAIVTDAIHDFCDSISIGISYFLEKKSKKKADKKFTYGYSRFSTLGALITTVILIVGSSIMIGGSVKRLLHPVEVNYDGMILFSIVGIIINFLAVYFTKDGHSLNEKSVNLHMLEDVFGWIIVFIGSVIIKFTNIFIIDSIMSLIVALFILYKAIGNLMKILNIFLEKIPDGISIDEIREKLLEIKEIIEVHDIHIWSIDGVNNYATVHVVTEQKDFNELRKKVYEILNTFEIVHTTVQIEEKNDSCNEKNCHSNFIAHKHKH